MPALHFNRPTARDKMRVETLHAVTSTMRDVASNTPLMLEIVANGPAQWRNTFLRTCRGLAVDERIADHMFAFFCQTVQRKYGKAPASVILDAVDAVTPPTQREIDEAWEVESASSESGRRHFYGRDGHPEQIIKQLRDVH